MSKPTLLQQTSYTPPNLGVAAEPPPRPRCDACAYFVRTQGSMEGQCRRYPPVPLSSMHSYFSEVSQGHWCGEFKQRDVATPTPTVEAKGSARRGR